MDDYAASIERAHETRVNRLRSATGWLSLVGKIFLPKGTTSLGSAPDSGARLPADAPAHLGTLVVDAQNVVHFTPAPNVSAKIDDVTLTAERVLKSDRDSRADALHIEGFVIEVMERGDAVALRIRDTRELPRPYAGIDRFPTDPSWRIEARFDEHPTPREVDLDYEGVQATSQISSAFISPGKVVFERDGQTHSIEAVYEDASKKRLFLLFRDTTATAGESYGLGRFLYAPLPNADGKVVLDFNQAMIPGCAFTLFATCPIPPKENRVNIPIRAGERSYRADPIGT